MKRCKMLLALVMTLFMLLPQMNVMAKEGESADWMAGVNGDVMLSAISIPGTHDTCTQYVSMGYIFQCQNASVAQQLLDGYRYFL